MICCLMSSLWSILNGDKKFLDGSVQSEYDNTYPGNWQIPFPAELCFTIFHSFEAGNANVISSFK